MAAFFLRILGDVDEGYFSDQEDSDEIDYDEEEIANDIIIYADWVFVEILEYWDPEDYELIMLETSIVCAVPVDEGTSEL